MTGRLVKRAIWDVNNLANWAKADLPLVAYCTRSLLELATMLWFVDRTGDWKAYFGLAATDLSDCVEKIIKLGLGPEQEGRENLKDLNKAYEQTGLVVPKETQRTVTDARKAGYFGEYDETFQLLSKYVHPTPLVLFSPPVSASYLDKVRHYFFMKAAKYLRTIYCLAAEQCGYNPAEIDVRGQLAQLRAELTPIADTPVDVAEPQRRGDVQ